MKYSRWPLHSTPVKGEALSSWLNRISAQYGQTLDQMLANELGHSDLSDSILDMAPPIGLVHELHRRTGFNISAIMAMTLKGRFPSLFDDPDSKTVDFNDYCSRYSVLLPATQRREHLVSQWRPWCIKDGWSTVRACRECVRHAGFFFYRLAWRLPLLSCCPEHGWMLERGVLGRPPSCHWPDSLRINASAELRSLDRRTLSALSRGYVGLPCAVLSAADWFHLIRVLIEELTARLALQVDPRAILEIWEKAGVPYRAGLNKWKPFEMLPDKQRIYFMHATAHALAALEAGDIRAGGKDAHLFNNRSPPDGYGSPWQGLRKLFRDMEQLIDASRADPDQARLLRSFLLFGHSGPGAVSHAEDLLNQAGIYQWSPN